MVNKKYYLVLLMFSLALAVVAATPANQNYSDLNITSDETVYSCWPSCLAYVNLTMDSSSELLSQEWNMTLNNSAEDSPIEFGIDWYNGTDWVNQSANNTFINGSLYNLTSGVHQFRVNISLTSALSTKWNVSFNINGSDYVLDPYLDSIALNSPSNNNITSDQTPEFNFTLTSDTWTTQTCTLYVRANETGSWLNKGSNLTTLSTKVTSITANATINEGNTTWKITCNETGDSATRWIYIEDGTAPSISSVSSSASSTSVLITWTTNEAANTTVNYGESYSLGNYSSSTAFSTAHSREILDLDPSTTYYYNVTSCDQFGNCATSGTHSFQTSAYSAPSSGGGGSSSASVTKSKTFAKITAENNQTWYVNSKDYGVKQINISVNNDTTGVVKITLQKYTSKPALVSVEKSGNVYKYLGIETQNLAEELREANLMIQVEQKWMENLSLGKEDISLYKFDNSSKEWKKITTTYEGEDSTYYYYNAALTSFSYFAIAGEKVVIAATNTSTTEEVATTTDATGEQGAETAEDEEDGGTSLAIIVLIIIVAVVALGVTGFIIYSQFFKKKK